MSCEDAIGSYCKAVSRELDVPSRRRAALLSGLQQELEDRFAGETSFSQEDLRLSVGSPGETARTLLESVPEEEQARYRARRRWLSRLTIAGLAVLLAALAVFFYYTEKTQVARVEETIIINSPIIIENTSEGEN